MSQSKSKISTTSESSGHVRSLAKKDILTPVKMVCFLLRYNCFHSWCVCIRVHVHTSPGACTSVSLLGQQLSTSGSLRSNSLCFLRQRSCPGTWGRRIRLNWLASEPQGSFCLCLLNWEDYRHVGGGVVCLFFVLRQGISMM